MVNIFFQWKMTYKRHDYIGLSVYFSIKCTCVGQISKFSACVSLPGVCVCGIGPHTFLITLFTMFLSKSRAVVMTFCQPVIVKLITIGLTVIDC